MALVEINWNPPVRMLRQFACLWLPLFAALVGLTLWRRTGEPAWAGAIWGFALAMAVLGIVRPQWVRPLFVGWMLLALPIGWAISHLILVMIYYLVMTPISLLMRLCGFDPMHRQLDRSATTYWVERHAAKDRARYFRQY